MSFNASSNCFDLLGDECSGHGQCIARTNTSSHGNLVPQSGGTEMMCLCDEGWSSSCDFIDTHKMQCPLNLLAIRILWGLNLLLIIFVMTESFEVFLFRTINYLKLRKERGIGIQQNKGLFAVYIYVIISLPAHICLSILKIINPDLHVGFDILTSIFFFFGNVGFYASTSVYQTALFASTFKKEELKKAQGLHIYNWIVWLSQILGALVGFIPLVLALESVDDSKTQQNIIVSYYALRCLSFLGNGLTTGIMVRQITIVLDKSAKTNEANTTKLLELKSKFVDIQSTAFKVAIVLGIFFFICACWPYMWTKHDYILPIMWILVPIMERKAVYAIHLDKHRLETVKETVKATAMAKIRKLGTDIKPSRGRSKTSKKDTTEVSSKGLSVEGKGSKSGNVSGIKSDDAEEPNENGWKRDMQPNVVATMIDIDEKNDIVIMENANEDFVPVPTSALDKEIVDAPELVLESLGVAQGFESRTIITTSEIVVHESELLLSRFPFLQNPKLYFLMVIGYLIGLIFMFMILLDAAPAELGYAAMAYIPLALILVLSSLSMKVLKRLFFESSLVASSVVTLLFTLSAWDVLQWDPSRCMAFTLIPFGAEVVLISDALFGGIHNFRFGFVMLAFLGTLIMLIIIQFNLLSKFRDSIIVIDVPNVGQGAQFSIYNFCRDSLIGQLLLLFRVVFHEMRGKSSVRFFNISEPVKVTYKSLDEEERDMAKMESAAERLGAKMKTRTSLNLKRKSLAKKMDHNYNHNVQSGFLVDENPAEYDKEERRAVFVYSDRIVLRESDTFLIRWFGKERGMRIIYWLTKKIAFRMFMLCCLVGPNILFFGFIIWGLAPPRYTIFCLLGFFPLIRSLLTTSKSMFLLQTKRLDFWLDVILIIVWFLSTSYTLYFDARSIITFIGCAMVFNAMLSDTRVLFSKNTTMGPRPPSRRSSVPNEVGTTVSQMPEVVLSAMPTDSKQSNQDQTAIHAQAQTSNEEIKRKRNKRSISGVVALLFRYLLTLFYLAYALFPWFVVLGMVYNVRLLRARPISPTSKSTLIDESDIIQSSFSLSLSFSFLLLTRLTETTKARKNGHLIDLRRPIKPRFIPTTDRSNGFSQEFSTPSASQQPNSKESVVDVKNQPQIPDLIEAKIHLNVSNDHHHEENELKMNHVNEAIKEEEDESNKANVEGENVKDDDENQTEIKEISFIIKTNESIDQAQSNDVAEKDTNKDATE